MSEPVLCVDGRDSFPGLLERRLKRLSRAGFRRSPGGLDRTQAPLRRRQVRRVRRQREPPGPATGQSWLHSRYFVSWQVVQHDTISQGQRGPEHLPHVSIDQLVSSCQHDFIISSMQ
jgi:hypothetical protein